MFGLTLEQSSDLGTAASALASLVLVAFAVYQLRMLARQLHLNTKATDAAARAADAAHEAVREAARARIDEQAPRVIAVSEPVQWPAFLSKVRTGMPEANETRMFEAMSLHGSHDVDEGEEFIFPEQAQQLLWFRMRGALINEGRSTARIRFDGEGRFIDGKSDLVPGIEILCPPVVGRVNETYLGREYLLRPNESALFEWACGHRLEDWADIWQNGMPPTGDVHVLVFDSTEQGIQDTIKITLKAQPIERVPGRDGHWRLRRDPEPEVIVHPTRRVYSEEVHHAPTQPAQFEERKSQRFA
jgi:hypothetical protein